MHQCIFRLNGKPISDFSVGARIFPAYSGIGKHVNQRISACVPNRGPTPPGDYFILDRQSGGRLGRLYDLFNDRSDWFALYAIDKNIDDSAWCENVKRGQFRIHPKGPRGVSEGCIVIDQLSDFNFLATILRGGTPKLIEGTDIYAWGTVAVR